MAEKEWKGRDCEGGCKLPMERCLLPLHPNSVGTSLLVGTLLAAGKGTTLTLLGVAAYIWNPEHLNKKLQDGTC
jgi:hypothetical protein